MPQKLVIRFKEVRPDVFKVDKGGYKYQMTINIPTYTKAAKIYKNLLEIMQKQSKAKKSDGPIKLKLESIKKEIEELNKKRNMKHE